MPERISPTNYELGPMNAIRSPSKVQNLDILDLVHRIDAYLMELSRCASATRRETSEHDLVRFKAMIERFEKRFELYASPPELDLPKYHPEPLRFPQPPEINRVENADVQQLINVWAALRIELAFSDSSERASAFKQADVGRIRAVMEKIRQVNSAIEDSPEIDLPDVNLQVSPAQNSN